MTTTAAKQTTIETLEVICSQLERQIAELSHNIDEHTEKLNGLSSERQSIQARVAVYAPHISHAQTYLATHLPMQRDKQLELEHAAGTSIAASIQTAIEALTTEVEKAQKELDGWQREMEEDRLDSERTFAWITDVQNELIAKTEKRNELTQTRQRFSTQLCDAIKQNALDILLGIDRTIAGRQAALDQARQARVNAVHQAAHDLAPWDREAREFLSMHGAWEDTSPAVIAAQSQLAAAEEDYKHAVRAREQTGRVDLDSTIASTNVQINLLAQRIESLRQQSREAQAIELLRQVKQTSL